MIGNHWLETYKDQELAIGANTLRSGVLITKLSNEPKIIFLEPRKD